MKYKQVQPIVALLRIVRNLDLMSSTSFIKFFRCYSRMLVARDVRWFKRDII